MELLRQAARDDGRYALEAYQFLYLGLDRAVQTAGRAESENRHVNGRELVEALRLLALETYGALAAEVWRRWGIRSTRDWGEIVFVLLKVGAFSKQDSDAVEDFDDIFDFEEGLTQSWRPELPPGQDLFAPGSRA